MAEASAGVQRLLFDLETSNLAAVESAFQSLSGGPSGSVSLSEVPTVLSQLGAVYGLPLTPVIELLDQSSPQSKRVSAVSLEELVEALRSWAETQRPEAVARDEDLRLQDLVFDPRADREPSGARSEREEKPPSDSTLARADSSEVVPSSKVQWALDYLAASKSTLRHEFQSSGATKTVAAFFAQSGLDYSEAALSRFDSLWLSASSAVTAPRDEFEEVFVPALQQLIGGKQRRAEAQEVTAQLIAKLETTIKEVEDIEKTLNVTGQDPTDTRNLLKTLRGQLSQLQKSAKSKTGGKQLFQAKCEKSLHEIYYFYAKQCKMIGKTPSFDEILHSTTTLTMGKFLKFLRDFGVLEAIKPKNKKVIDREVTPTQTATRSFKKVATLQKEMDETQFKTALDLLALWFYDGLYDSLNGTHVAVLSLQEKREMLYRVLELDNEKECARKMKGYGVPFSSYTDNRIPPNDPAKGYKYREYTSQRMTIEQWKNRVQGRKPSSNPPNSQAIVVYKPFSSPEDSPKRSRPLKKPLPLKAKSVATSQEFFTTKALDEIDPAQLADVDSDPELKELIAEASSEDDSLLAKQYPMKPKPPPAKELSEPPKKADPRQSDDLARAEKISQPHIARGNEVQKRVRAAVAKFSA